MYLIGHQQLKWVTNIQKLSPTHLSPTSVTNSDLAELNWLITDGIEYKLEMLTIRHLKLICRHRNVTKNDTCRVIKISVAKISVAKISVAKISVTKMT